MTAVGYVGGGGGGGTPSNTVVTETSFGQAATAGASGAFSRGDHTHGTPAAPSSSPAIVIARKRITSGHVTGSNTGGVYVVCNNGVEDFTKSIPCVVDDYVEVTAHALISTGSMRLEYVALNGATIVQYGSTNTGLPAFEGDPSLYNDATFVIAHSGASFIVTAPMISAGSVTFGLARIGSSGSGQIFGDANYPFRLTIRNYGAVTVL